MSDLDDFIKTYQRKAHCLANDPNAPFTAFDLMCMMIDFAKCLKGEKSE